MLRENPILVNDGIFQFQIHYDNEAVGNYYLCLDEKYIIID